MPRNVRSQLLAEANQIPLRNAYPLMLEELPISNLDSLEGITHSKQWRPIEIPTSVPQAASVI